MHFVALIWGARIWHKNPVPRFCTKVGSKLKSWSLEDWNLFNLWSDFNLRMVSNLTPQKKIPSRSIWFKVVRKVLHLSLCIFRRLLLVLDVVTPLIDSGPPFFMPIFSMVFRSPTLTPEACSSTGDCPFVKEKAPNLTPSSQFLSPSIVTRCFFPIRARMGNIGPFSTDTPWIAIWPIYAHAQSTISGFMSCSRICEVKFYNFHSNENPIGSLSV